MTRKTPEVDEQDFATMDRLARGMSPAQMRPMSPAMRQRWRAAQRGRPRKAPGTKAVPTMITVEPALLKRIDSGARKAGLSRSQFLAAAARRELNC